MTPVGSVHVPYGVVAATTQPAFIGGLNVNCSAEALAYSCGTADLLGAKYRGL